ncbi:hypothetical protein ACQFN5_29065 (plasmid) [Klebsiella sp. WOUb02]|uniref:hypothetical protein n=1 Tax=Klebsiella sp. WOUb02 TaxID=3161071 RepID=UPI003CEE3D7F
MRKHTILLAISCIALLSQAKATSPDTSWVHSADKNGTLQASALVEGSDVSEPDDDNYVRLTKNEYDELVWKAKTYPVLNSMETGSPRDKTVFSWDFFWAWLGGSFTTALIYFFAFRGKKMAECSNTAQDIILGLSDIRNKVWTLKRN